MAGSNHDASIGQSASGRRAGSGKDCAAGTMTPSPAPGSPWSAAAAGGVTRGTLHGTAVTFLRSGSGATATVADHGAQLLSWCPAAQDERLYLSEDSGYADGEAIRGGVPVIFPQFGAMGPGRRHGVVRHRAWHAGASGVEAAGGVVWAQWEIADILEAALAAGFRLVLTVRLGKDWIEIALRIGNHGAVPLACQAALHTYLRVADLADAALAGLQGCRYADQTLLPPVAQRQQSQQLLGFKGEIDRIYPKAPAALLLTDGRQQLALQQRGFADTVVWNPGAVKAAALADLAPGGYRQFVCIEAAAVLTSLQLGAGETWEGVQRLRALRVGDTSC
jgi:glucose-6-phosphate 1-epimerase